MHRKMTRIFAALPLLFLVSLSHSAEVPIDVWLHHLTVALPVGFCEQGSAIRSCFTVTNEQCEQGVVSATRVCINGMKRKLPKFIRSKDEGAKLGGDIGSCAEDAFVLANKQREVLTQDCIAAKEKVPNEANQNK